MADWQQLVALIITAMAGIYLLRRLRRQSEDPESVACGGCRGCDRQNGSDSDRTLPLVSLNSPIASGEQLHSERR